MKRSGPKYTDIFFVRYKREFVITAIVITEFDRMSNFLFHFEKL
jgi:hypothetical protein